MLVTSQPESAPSRDLEAHKRHENVRWRGNCSVCSACAQVKYALQTVRFALCVRVPFRVESME
jgi:hypothetical protein